MLTIVGYVLIVGSATLALQSIPHYLKINTALSSVLLSLANMLFIQCAQVLGLGLLCLYASRRLEKNND